MTRLFLEPFDVWLFRDGRPFTAGADHHARSLFPPSGLTLYGALRSKRLMAAADRGDGHVVDDAFVERTVGRPDDFEQLRLRGPLLGRRDPDGRVRRYFPAPLDLVRLGRDGGVDWRLLAPRADVPGLVTDAGGAVPWAATSERPEAVEGWWLAEADFFQTLVGEPREACPAGELYDIEVRSGLELDRAADGRARRVAREGRLYSVAFVRPRPGVGIVLDVERFDELAPSGLIGLGGEGRASRYQTLAADEPSRTAARERVAATGRLKLILATPAVFGHGWLPSWVDPTTRRTGGQAGGLRLVAAAVGRPTPLGGFNVRAGRPRQVRPAVPAGSVYWLAETERGVAARAFDALDGQMISEEYASIGHGLCYVGVW